MPQNFARIYESCSREASFVIRTASVVFYMDSQRCLNDAREVESLKRHLRSFSLLLKSFEQLSVKSDLL